MGLVSIIIPSYNYGHLICETLQSVVKQTYPNWECIIVDDGSNDETATVVANFLKNHPQYNFTFIESKNRGTSAAKNIGIKHAKGQYIQFLDADDLLSHDKLSIQVAIANEVNAGLVFSKTLFFVGDVSNGKYIDRYPEGFLAAESLKGFELFKRLVINNVLTISSPLIKKDLVVNAGMFNEQLRNNEDWQLWFKVAQIDPNFIFDYQKESFVLVRVHPNSAMNNHKNMFLGEVTVRKFIDQSLLKLEKTDEIAYLKKLNLDLLALHQVRSLSMLNGFSYILRSFVENPLKECPLLIKSILKLGIRVYKSLGK